MQIHANYIQMSWPDWKIVLHQHLPSQKKYGSTVILWFIFELNHNFRILFHLKSLTASLRKRS